MLGGKKTETVTRLTCPIVHTLAFGRDQGPDKETEKCFLHSDYYSNSYKIKQDSRLIGRKLNWKCYTKATSIWCNTPLSRFITISVTTNDWSGVYTNVCYNAIYSRINFLVSLFLLSSVLHLYGFNLGQHCEGRQGIDFCLRGLMGTTLRLSSWGFAGGCDNTQNIPLNLSANLRPHQAKLGITWCLPP